MSLIAFAGPSLTGADRAAHPQVDWRPPAEAGDLLKLRAGEGTVVCLIDGYFDHRPAVRHKELLLLLSRSVMVLGASSIGALRAAEMAPFGMIGVGVIYRAFASGRLCGDDEVALVHASSEWDWKALSLPLVDCRTYLHRARRAGVIGPQEARQTLNAATSIYYADRVWPDLLEKGGIPAPRRTALLDWIAFSEFSQKRLDALSCIAAAKEGGFRKAAAPPMVRTSLLEALARECGVAPEELD